MTRPDHPQDAPEALITARRAQAAAAHQRATAAIREMTKQRQPLTFASVARHAGVSRRFLYNHDDLASLIRSRRTNTPGTPTPIVDTPHNGTDPIVAALRDQIRRIEAAHKADVARLEARIKGLSQENARLLGKLLGS